MKKPVSFVKKASATFEYDGTCHDPQYEVLNKSVKDVDKVTETYKNQTDVWHNLPGENFHR
eukprot:UN18573